MATVKFILNKMDLALFYKVHVTKASGLFSIPKLKERVSGDWSGNHGKIYDVSKPYFDERKITLDCYIKGTSKINCYSLLNAFKLALISAELKQLLVFVDGDSNLDNMLAFNVLLASEEINPSLEWDSEIPILKFSLPLIEPEPCKIVLAALVTGDTNLS